MRLCDSATISTRGTGHGCSVLAVEERMQAGAGRPAGWLAGKDAGWRAASNLAGGMQLRPIPRPARLWGGGRQAGAGRQVLGLGGMETIGGMDAGEGGRNLEGVALLGEGVAKGLERGEVFPELRHELLARGLLPLQLAATHKTVSHHQASQSPPVTTTSERVSK